jgi:CHASE2 domain-containing sensor protein
VELSRDRKESVMRGKRRRRPLAVVLASCGGGLWVLGFGGFFFGMAYYGDDTPDQVWQFEVGLSVGLVGLALAVVLSIAAALAAWFIP